MPKFNKTRVRNIINVITKTEDVRISFVNIIFCTDNYLLEINNHYLKHDYFTDIITFDYDDNIKGKSSDLFISIERKSDNASSLCIPLLDELYRVIIHGILHLCGYEDGDILTKNMMTQKENHYLSLI